MKQDTFCKIKIEFSDGVKHKIELSKPFLGRKLFMFHNNKRHIGMVTVTQIINRIRKLIVKYV